MKMYHGSLISANHYQRKTYESYSDCVQKKPVDETAYYKSQKIENMAYFDGGKDYAKNFPTPQEAIAEREASKKGLADRCIEARVGTYKPHLVLLTSKPAAKAG